MILGDTIHHLRKVVRFVCKSDDFSMERNKQKVYVEIVRLLEEVDGVKRTPRFIGNLLRESQLPGKDTAHAIDRLYKKKVKKKKPKPKDDEISKRTIVIYGTKAEADQYREKFPDPRERMLDMLHNTPLRRA